MMDPKLDCKYYIGEKPCIFKLRCNGCPEYTQRGIQILIIKLGAMGDALRTTPLLYALKRKFPVSTVTWITDLESQKILKNNPLIDELIINLPEYTLPLLSRRFDWAVCLDKDSTVTSLILQLNCSQKFGFCMSPYGTLDILNDASRYALALGIDDELKFFINKKTYQEIIYEIAELPYQRDEYIFHLSESDLSAAQTVISSLKAPGTGPSIALNTGCGDIFATKKWPMQHFIELAKMLRNRLDAKVYLLGGDSEVRENKDIETILNGDVVNTGAHPLSIFAGIIKSMDAIVASDTMALHMALAVNTPVLGLFGSTCYQEIDFYERGQAIVAKRDCTPCYRRECKEDVSCMHDLKPANVFEILVRFVNYREN